MFSGLFGEVGEETLSPTAWGGAGHTVAAVAYSRGVDSYWTAVLWSLLPTVVVSVLFFFVLRGIIRMDRTERRVHADIEAEERSRRGLPKAAPGTAD